MSGPASREVLGSGGGIQVRLSVQVRKNTLKGTENEFNETFINNQPQLNVKKL